MFLLGALLFGVACNTAVSEPSETVTASATVKLSTLEGGFYYLHGDEGGDYDPTNLAAEYKQDGKRVKAKMKIRADLANTHQFGVMVDILEISALP